MKTLPRMSRREQIMLSALLMVGALIWISSLWDRWDSVHSGLQTAQREASLQQVWLRNEPFLRQQLRQTLETINSSDTLSETALIALVDTYSRQRGLTQEISNPVVTRGEIYSRTELRLTFRNMPMEELVRFHLFLEDRHPYVSLEGIALTPNRADMRLLNVRMRLSALRINDPLPFQL